MSEDNKIHLFLLLILVCNAIAEVKIINTNDHSNHENKNNHLTLDLKLPSTINKNDFDPFDEMAKKMFGN